METIKQTVFNNWHAMRWLRLGLGIFLGINAIQTHDSLSGIIGALLLFQAATNSGCGGSCAVPMRAGKNDALNETKIEEVKTK